MPVILLFNIRDLDVLPIDTLMLRISIQDLA